MAGAGRSVVQPSVLSDRPTGDPYPSRNVDPAARQYLSQYAYLQGAAAVLGTVPSIGNPAAGGLGPNWPAAGQSQTPPTPPSTSPGTGPTGSLDDGCCG